MYTSLSAALWTLQADTECCPIKIYLHQLQSEIIHNLKMKQVAED